MSSLIEQVERAIRKQRLFRHAEPILVAVSGGVDSMVLLRILHELCATHAWRLTIAHLNHRIRGSSSNADERLVRGMAQELRLKLVVERVDVPEFRRVQGVSLEMAARQARHEFLARTAVRLGITSIALGHHADDQLELFFLRLLRGSGGEGLAGMKWRNRSPLQPQVYLVRPLRCVAKETLRQYARDCGVKFREDASNTCLDIQRNRIRQQLLPLLKKEYQPALDATVLRTMDVIGAEAEFAAMTAGKWLAQRERTPFEELPVAVQRRCIELQLLDLGVPPNYDLVEHLRLCEGKPVSARMGKPDEGNAQALAQKGVVREASGTVRLSPGPPATFNGAFREINLNKGRGNAQFGGLKIVWRISAKAGFKRLQPLPGREYFDAEAVGRQITLRHWRPGDRFQPSGMRSPVKLQDLFINQKVPREQRHELVVAVCMDDQVFWVEGLRISERFKLAKHSNRRLHWQWRRL